MTEVQESKLYRIIKKLVDAKNELSNLQTEWPYLNGADERKVAEASEHVKRAIDCL